MASEQTKLEAVRGDAATEVKPVGPPRERSDLSPSEQSKALDPIPLRSLAEALHQRSDRLSEADVDRIADEVAARFMKRWAERLSSEKREEARSRLTKVLRDVGIGIATSALWELIVYFFTHGFTHALTDDQQQLAGNAVRKSESKVRLRLVDDVGVQDLFRAVRETFPSPRDERIEALLYNELVETIHGQLVGGLAVARQLRLIKDTTDRAQLAKWLTDEGDTFKSPVLAKAITDRLSAIDVS